MALRSSWFLLIAAICVWLEWIWRSASLSLEWIFYLTSVLLGFDPRVVLLLLAFNLRYSFLLHTEAIGTLRPLA